MSKIFSFIKRLWWLILIGALIGGFVAWKIDSAKAAAIKNKTYTVKRDNLIDSLTISGQIDSFEKANLQFQTSGLLAWVGVKEGDYVKKYQVVASLDKRELQNQMTQLLNTYLKTRWDFEQKQEDNTGWMANGMTNDARDTIKRTLEKSQFDLNNSVLNVEAQDLTLKFANLWSPIEGLVTVVDTPQAGVNVTPTSANIMVVNPKTVYLSVSADQTEVTKFKPGQKGEVVLDSYPDQKISGTIQSVGFTPMVGGTGTVYELKMTLDQPNDDYRFKIGMTGDATFVFSEKDNVLVVPEAFIKEKNGQKYVTLVKGDQMIATNIETGQNIEGTVEILSGLNENDVIYN